MTLVTERRNPHNPFAAPGYLEVLRRFVNTSDVEAGTDSLCDPVTGVRWLQDWGLLDDGVDLSEDDLAELVALRESFRGLLAANESGSPAPPGDEAMLDRYLARVRATVVGGELRFEARGPGARAPFERLAAIAATAMVAGTWPRLKVCGNDLCRWAFYDSSRNRMSRWCRMETCGNRAKARRYRERHSTAPKARTG